MSEMQILEKNGECLSELRGRLSTDHGSVMLENPVSDASRLMLAFGKFLVPGQTSKISDTS